MGESQVRREAAREAQRRAEGARRRLTRTSSPGCEEMGPRSIVNYVFIVGLAALFAAWAYATYHMILMATGPGA